MSRRTAGDRALYFASLLYWILGRNEKASDYVEKSLKMSSSSSQGLILKGWIFLTSENDVERSQAARYFDSGLRDSKDVFGLMGKAEFFMVRQNESRALDMVNQIIASHPQFIPALVLKMNIFMSHHNWDQAAEDAERILETDVHNLKALQMMSVISIQTFTFLFLQCGHSEDVVQMLTSFVQRAVSRAPDDSALASELGYLLTLQHKYKEAHRWYTKALNLDPGSVTALEGMIRCQLMDGQVEEAAQQLDFFHEVQQSLGRSAVGLLQLTLLQALLAQKKGAAQESVVALLKEATELHLQALRGLPHSVDYLQRLDLNFLLQVVRMHLANSEDTPYDAGQPHPFGLKHSSMILEAVIRAAPGVFTSCYYMAQVKFLTGDQAASQHFLNLCMEKEPAMPEIHLLQAKLHLRAGDYSKCLNCLESGISYNFELRQMPQYNLIKARALKGTGELTAAIQCLCMVLSMPGVRRVTEGQKTSLSLSERASVFLELVGALRLNGEQHEAAKVMQDAIWQFKETPEEMRVMVANVDLALAKDDVDTALNVLQSVPPGKSSYIQAKEKMACIYLERMRNKKFYIECYREICEHLPGPHSSVLLADAFMKIQEPEKAIEVYQEAVKMAPKDATFATKIGQALVRTHQYDKAVNYYETALSTSMQNSVCLELAELLLKLKRFERAQQILEKALDHEDSTNLSTMMNDVAFLRILVKVMHAKNEPCLDKLQQIYELQQKIVRRLSFEQPEKIDQQKRMAAVICCELAQKLCSKHDLEKAKQFYSEALIYCADDIEIAQLYYEHHSQDYCEDQCFKILKLDEKHTSTSMLLADVLFRKNQKEEAIKRYTDIIYQYPGNFHALAKLLHMLRWVGRLDDVLPFFKTCETYSPTAVTEPGYNYCKGLYYWEALIHLNQARGDPEWGEDAVELMVHICLNPDKDTFGGEYTESSAQAFMLLKQSPRARNFLKRISKAQWTHATAEDFEKSCLLLADMYIKTGKYTNAEKLLDDCIRYNMSCSRAYEYKGFMMENDQRYKDAAQQYELAWKYSYCTDPYSLAANLYELKAKCL
uniref:Tetratricopeptide repeat domain 21B n=1 Tax=Pygocentrus nattereri TaxID=42514 RepID=A0AAR2IPM8_PYGNA